VVLFTWESVLPLHQAKVVAVVVSVVVVHKCPVLQLLAAVVVAFLRFLLLLVSPQAMSTANRPGIRTRWLPPPVELQLPPLRLASQVLLQVRIL